MPAFDDHVVVLRFWHENETTELAPSRYWRARITYINAGQQFHAASVEDAFAIVKSILASAASAK
jgi:hypothetical protein